MKKSEQAEDTAPRLVIVRPPLSATFAVPSREGLLALQAGDFVKLMVQVENEAPERLWVALRECDKPAEWVGAVANEAYQPRTATALPCGAVLCFHPLDVIEVMERPAGMPN